MKYLAFAVLGFAVSFVWARYTVAASRHQALRASFWGVAIYGVGCISAINYIADHTLILPLAVGDFAGTYVTLKWLSK